MTKATPTPNVPAEGLHTTTQLGANSVAGNSVGGRQPDEPVPEGIDPTVNSDGTPQPGSPASAQKGQLQPDTNTAATPTVTHKGRR